MVGSAQHYDPAVGTGHLCVQEPLAARDVHEGARSPRRRVAYVGKAGYSSLRRRCNPPRSNSALISPASSTTLLNLICASSSRALASLLHHRLEPPVSHRQRQRSPPQPELPARNSTISIVRCVRGATDLASQSARTVHALQKVPTTTHVPPFHYQISRRRVTLSPWRALLCSEPPSTGPDCVVAGALVGLSCPPVRQRTR